MIIETRDAWHRDVAPMLEVVRQADRAEWAAAGGFPMSAHLHEAISLAERRPQHNVCRITLADNAPMLMWGVNCTHRRHFKGQAWMIAAEGAKAIQRQLHKATLPLLGQLYEPTGYTSLVCSVYDRNLDHHRWLEWLGFKATGVRPQGPLGLPFIDYERRA